MNRCPQCENLVIFGGVEVGNIRFCNSRCQKNYEDSRSRITSPEIDENWERQKEEAQSLTHYTIDGEKIPRVRCGDEDYWEGESCGDCGVRRGQLHIPGCDMEVCPATGEQAISSKVKIAELPQI